MFRRRAAGETLRSLAADYGVSHTTLSRYLRRPAARAELKRVARLLREEQHEAERLERSRRRLAGRRGDDRAGRQQSHPAPVPVASAAPAASAPAPRAIPAAPTRPRGRTAYGAWLDSHDARRPYSRADLHSRSDTRAAEAVAAGGGIQAVIDATGLRTLANVELGIDPEILAHARHNDALQASANQLGLDSGPA